MKTLRSTEFLEITRENPEWAKSLTENVTIMGSVFLPENHPIKALNPKLIFQDHADFSRSRISIAEGVFHQGVNFSHSKIREIGELTVLGTNEYGRAASFWGCKSLTLARGTFPGSVDFSESGIQEIADDLHVTAPSKKGYAAIFRGCKKLTIARGTFPGFVFFGHSGIQEISETLCVTAPNKDGDAAEFEDCKNLTVASGRFCGTVNFSGTPITHARNLEITVKEGKPKAIFTELCLEESPFPLEEIQVPEELKKKLHRKIVQKRNIQKLHKNLEKYFPSIPQEI